MVMVITVVMGGHSFGKMLTKKTWTMMLIRLLCRPSRGHQSTLSTKTFVISVAGMERAVVSLLVMMVLWNVNSAAVNGATTGFVSISTVGSNAP